MTQSIVRMSGVRAAVERHWVRGTSPQPVILLAGEPRWDGPATLEVGDVAVEMRTAASPLAIREVLAERGDRRVVVVTDVAEQDVGRDVLAVAVRHEVLVGDQWEDVRLAFSMSPAAPIDPRLVRLGTHFARALVAVRPASGWSPAASGILTHEHVMRQLATSLLELEGDRFDGAGVLDWSMDVRRGLLLRALPEEVREPLSTWLLDKAGLGMRRTIDLVTRGDGDSAASLGILTSLAWGRAGGRRDGRAQGLIESRLGSHPSEQEIDAWWTLLDGWVSRQGTVEPPRVIKLLERADELARELNLGDALGDDDLRPSSLVGRLGRAAHAVSAAAAEPSGRNLMVAEQAVHHAQRHRASSLHPSDVDAVRMSLRVVRWLATSPQPHEDLAAALGWQIEVGGWVDRARQVVANGSGDSAVATGLEQVHARGTSVRSAIDRAAAERLAHAVATDQDPGGLIPVEDAIRTLLPSTVAGVLLVVVDGMSAAVATELVESAAAHGWTEVVREAGSRRGVLAGLPTMTEVSRASLLSGRRTRGGQDVERRGLKEVLGDRARLFHKADLAPAPGHDVARDVRDALLDAEVEVVVAVLNTVDDSLSSGTPGRTGWTIDAVTHLPQLLQHAGAASRTVVLTSDHGHVIDREPGVLRSAAGGSGRWRPVEGTIHDDEVLLEGSRVQAPGGEAVAAVDEQLRYGRRAAGYHGGAALAEVAIPWVVIARPGSEPSGYVRHESAAPHWWHEPVDTSLLEESDSLF